MSSLTPYVIYIDGIFSLLWWLGYLVIGVLFLTRYVLSESGSWTLYSFGWANLFLSVPFAASLWASVFPTSQGIAWISGTFHVMGCFFILFTFTLLTNPHPLIPQWDWPEFRISTAVQALEQGTCTFRLFQICVCLVFGSLFFLTMISMIQYSAIIGEPIPKLGVGTPIILFPFWAAVVYYALAAFASFTAGYLGLQTLYTVGAVYKVAFALCLRGLHDILHIFQIWSAVQGWEISWFLGLQLILLLLGHLLYFEALLPELLFFIKELRQQNRYYKGGN